MIRVGLTGGIATGKTAVSDLLRARGAWIIDADLLAREVVEPGTPAHAAIVQRFGPSVLAEGALPDAGLDRAALGKIIFNDPAARADLERIIHPAVRARAAELEAEAPPEAIVVHVVPLLVETGQQDDFDLVVVVDADPQTQLERLASRNSLVADEAQARLAAQATREQRLAVADCVVANRGTFADLQREVDELWTNLAAAQPEH